MPWWLWALFGVAACAGETVNLTFFLLYVGVAAFAAAVLAFAGIAAAAQFGAFIVLSVLLIFLIRPRMVHALVGRVPARALTNQGRMKDRTGTVIDAVTGDSGHIRLGAAEFWTARVNPPATRVEPGQTVRVAYVDGLTAYVDPISLQVETPPAPGVTPLTDLAREEI